MKQQLGVLLQFATLVFLPVLVVWEVTLRFPLIVMPAALLGSYLIFNLGAKLRES
ncbi:MAG: hypothetical protein O3A00_22505 [Planctomycetota bacterium]|nr:hypothetical protein [Planctomycetota bacterium]